MPVNMNCNKSHRTTLLIGEGAALNLKKKKKVRQQNFGVAPQGHSHRHLPGSVTFSLLAAGERLLSEEVVVSAGNLGGLGVAGSTARVAVAGLTCVIALVAPPPPGLPVGCVVERCKWGPAQRRGADPGVWMNGLDEYLNTECVLSAHPPTPLYSGQNE